MGARALAGSSQFHPHTVILPLLAKQQSAQGKLISNLFEQKKLLWIEENLTA